MIKKAISIFNKEKAYYINILLKISLISLMAVLSITLFSCNKEKEHIPIESLYEMNIEFDNDMNTCSLEQSIYYQNNTSYNMDNLKLHLFANAFKSEDSIANGEIDVLSIHIDSLSASFDISSTILTINTPIKANQSLVIDIVSEIDIPQSTSRFGKNDSTINFTGFYPVFCLIENGKWRDDPYLNVGDPFFQEISSYYVKATFPSKYTLASSGAQSITSDNNISTVDIVAEQIRDFAMVFSDKFKVKTAQATLSNKTVSINYYYIDDSYADNSLAISKSSIEVFSNAFGDYPYSTYSVCQSPLNAGGMEYGSLSIVAPFDSKNLTERVIVHETAHQWWHGVVGSDQINSAWIDESLAEFSSYYYYYLTEDFSTYNKMVDDAESHFQTYVAQPPVFNFNDSMDRPLSSFISAGEYVAVVYDKGALMYDNILKLIGKVNLNKALSVYYNQNYMKIATKQSLEKAFNDSGQNLSPLLNSWINGSSPKKISA